MHKLAVVWLVDEKQDIELKEHSQGEGVIIPDSDGDIKFDFDLVQLIWLGILLLTTQPYLCSVMCYLFHMVVCVDSGTLKRLMSKERQQLRDKL